MKKTLVVVTLSGCGSWSESANEGEAMRPAPVDISIALDDGSTTTSSEDLVLMPIEASGGAETDCAAGLEFHQARVRQVDLRSPSFLEAVSGTRSALDASAWLTWTDSNGDEKMWNGVLSVVEWTDVLHSFDMLEGVVCTNSDAACAPGGGSLAMSTSVAEMSEAGGTVAPGSWTDQASETQLCEGVFSGETGGG